MGLGSLLIQVTLAKGFSHSIFHTGIVTSGRLSQIPRALTWLIPFLSLISMVMVGMI